MGHKKPLLDGVEIPREKGQLWSDILEYAYTSSWRWKWLIILLKIKNSKAYLSGNKWVTAGNIYKYGCTVLCDNCWCKTGEKVIFVVCCVELSS